MQDFEFTIEDGSLYMLQTRNGKRTGLAAVRIAVEMNRERLMDRKTALLKIPAESIDSLLVPVFDKKAQQDAHRIGHGLAAGPGRHQEELFSRPSRQRGGAPWEQSHFGARGDFLLTICAACCWLRVFLPREGACHRTLRWWRANLGRSAYAAQVNWRSIMFRGF